LKDLPEASHFHKKSSQVVEMHLNLLESKKISAMKKRRILRRNCFTIRDTRM